MGRLLSRLADIDRVPASRSPPAWRGAAVRPGPARSARRTTGSPCCAQQADFEALAPPACPGSTSASAPASCSGCSARRADVVGVDCGSHWTRRRAGRACKALQGNLDPAVLLAPWDVRRTRAAKCSNAAAPPRPHLQSRPRRAAETDPGVLAQLTDLVHTESVRLQKEPASSPGSGATCVAARSAAAVRDAAISAATSANGSTVPAAVSSHASLPGGRASCGQAARSMGPLVMTNERRALTHQPQRHVA